jgi:hypothetical protein
MKTRSIPTPENWQTLQPHPLSEVAEFGVGINLDGLADHMGNHGYDADEAIVLYEGMILDGRHKHAAAIMAGVTPTFKVFEGDDPSAYVAKKLFRQHLNESQRAMMAATLAKVLAGNSSTFQGGRPANLPDQPPSQSQVAETMNVSERSVRDAVKVQRDGTEELNRAVMDGTLSVSDAAKVAAQPLEIQDAAVEAVRKGQAGTVTEAAEALAADDSPESPAAEEGRNGRAYAAHTDGEEFKLRSPYRLGSWNPVLEAVIREVRKLGEAYDVAEDNPAIAALNRLVAQVDRQFRKVHKQLSKKRRKE